MNPGNEPHFLRPASIPVVEDEHRLRKSSRLGRPSQPTTQNSRARRRTCMSTNDQIIVGIYQSLLCRGNISSQPRTALHHAAVNDNGRSRNVAGPVSGQKGNNVGDFFGFRHSAQRNRSIQFSH